MISLRMRSRLVRIACKYASEKEDVMSAFQGNAWLQTEITSKYNQTTRFMWEVWDTYPVRNLEIVKKSAYLQTRVIVGKIRLTRLPCRLSLIRQCWYINVVYGVRILLTTKWDTFHAMGAKYFERIFFCKEISSTIFWINIRYCILKVSTFVHRTGLHFYLHNPYLPNTR